MKLLLPLLIILPVIFTAQRTRAETLPQVVVEDQARIREHLASVEEYLRSQDTSHLTLAQRRFSGDEYRDSPRLLGRWRLS